MFRLKTEDPDEKGSFSGAYRAFKADPPLGGIN